MRIVVLGDGVLGRRLEDLSDFWNSYEVHMLSVDITDPTGLMEGLSKLGPDLVINTAAKTGVDWCETNPVAALQVNAIGAGIAAYVTGVGAHFVQVSTDYVFSGYSKEPYTVDDAPYPVNVYGSSKLFGERAVSVLGPERSTIVRVGWLFGVEYPKCAPMLAADTYEEWVRGGLKGRHRAYIWDDVFGTPTHVKEVAELLLEDAGRYPELPQVVHLAPDEEPVSWYEFLEDWAPEIRRSHVKDTPLKAVRPMHGGLRPSPGFVAADYDVQLENFIGELHEADSGP